MVMEEGRVRLGVGKLVKRVCEYMCVMNWGDKDWFLIIGKSKYIL